MQPGTLISPHIRLEEILGRGSSGVVWLASNVAIGGTLAVKVLGAAHEGAVDTVRREASIIGRIQSPHMLAPGTRVTPSSFYASSSPRRSFAE